MRGKLSISLKAIRENYRFLQEKTGHAVCAAVVKADAYGLGIAPVATALHEEGASHFFVALPEEGAALRAVLPEAEIYVLNGILPGDADCFKTNRLIPVLNGPEQAALWQDHAPCALHVDTGLNRLGWDADALQQAAGLNVRMLMSHLACADTPEHPLNAQQRERFEQATASYPGIRYSLAASDGIFCGSDFHFDMVRPGAALYGLNPTPNRANPMKPVIRLSVPVLQTREVQQDGHVGYAATQAVRKGQRLATVSLGYADGFFRSLSNRGVLYHGEQALPVMGRVSMDVVVVDISALPENTLPENALKAGDWLDVFGPGQSPDDLAKQAGTIGYEMLTALGRRFDRVYTS